MRCPKCGYISFDHLSACLNCSKDISEASSAAHGTTYHASAPMFLKILPSDGPRNPVPVRQAVPEELASDLDVVDPDLNILINDDDEEGGIDFNPDDASLKAEFGGDDASSFDIALEKTAPALEDDGLAVDLSRFEDAGLEGGGEEKFAMSLPDELADISDLEPPPPPRQQPPAVSERKALDEGVDFDALDMDLKLDGLDEGFSLVGPDKGGLEDGIGSLSLDDIDLGASLETKPAPAAAKPAPVQKPGEMDMDSDLDFSLDLGGLSLPKK